jgi:hypothetical protein
LRNLVPLIRQEFLFKKLEEIILAQWIQNRLCSHWYGQFDCLDHESQNKLQIFGTFFTKCNQIQFNYTQQYIKQNKHYIENQNITNEIISF